MPGFLSRIKQYREEVSQQQNVKAASNLQRLREERIRQEGKARLVAAQQKEESRIQAAKKTNFSNTTLGKLSNFVGSIKANKQKGVRTTKATTKRGYIPQGINQGSSGLQLGGNTGGIQLGGSGQSPFNQPTRNIEIGKSRGLEFGTKGKSPFK